MADLGATKGNGKSGTALLVAAGVMYEIIAAACSSPQTAELNAKARAKTLKKWVWLGIAQGAFFVLLTAFYDRKVAKPVISGGAIAAGLLFWQYDHAIKSGLRKQDAGAPPTEDYNFGWGGKRRIYR